MRVLLALPTGGAPCEPFLDSLRTLELPPSVTAFDRITVSGNFIPGQRELAARRALALDADVLLMFDDDMIVPPDAVTLLLEALESDPQLAVAGGLYYSRDGVHPMVANRWMSNDTTTATVPAFDSGLTYCDAVGFGCVALRVSVLAMLQAPYFEAQAYVEEDAARVRLCNEDYLYCQRVRRAGRRVALHAGVRCGHYDRTSARIYPLAWEPAAQTRMERMVVVDHGREYRLAPFDPLVPRIAERHETTTIDYIIVK